MVKFVLVAVKGVIQLKGGRKEEEEGEGGGGRGEKKTHCGHDRFSYPAGISEISHKYWRCVSFTL